MDQENLEEQGVSEHTGFPNAATDARLNALDLSKLLVRHPSSTFYMRVDGDSGQQAGIYAGDIIVIDRALEPKKSDLVVWWEDQAFVISLAHKVAENIRPWGVITFVIHSYRNSGTHE